MLISFKKEEYSNNGRPLFRKLSKQDIWLNEDIPIYSGNDIRVIEISKFVSIVKKI